jgi:glycosyltransferase involved in cell wall biosynthesis
MGLADGDVSLAFVANELHRKGFETLLRALAATGRPRLRVDVVGRRSIDDYRPLISRLGLADRVRWHGPAQDAALPLAGADALVLPTFYEPFGLVVVEALASGTPVVVSALAGAAPLVGDAGVLLDDPSDVGQLAAALRVLEDDQARADLAANAPATVADLTWEHQLGRVERVLLAADGRRP